MAKKTKQVMTITRFNKSIKRIKKGKEGRELAYNFTESAIYSIQEKQKLQLPSQVKSLLRKIASSSQTKEHRQLASLLGIVSQQDIFLSMHKITSIENMISIQNIGSIQEIESDYGSCFSIDEGYSFIVLDDQPDSMIIFLVLLEKTFASLGCSLTKKQNKLLIKGVWNICMKFYHKRSEQHLYSEINHSIQWGIFEILGFNLLVTESEKILLKQKLKNTSFINS